MNGAIVGSEKQRKIASDGCQSVEMTTVSGSGSDSGGSASGRLLTCSADDQQYQQHGVQCPHDHAHKTEKLHT